MHKYLGIDIGSYNMKIADITISKNVTMDNLTIVKTPRFLIQNGRIPEKDEFIALLKETLLKRNSKIKNAVIVLNDSVVITRDKVLPSGNRKELGQMVKIDASEYLPNGIDNYTIRYKILDSPDNSKNSSYVLMTSVRNDMLMDLYECFRKAGVKPVAIDTTMNSMLKYMKRCSLKSNVAMIDLGAAYTKLILTANGTLNYQQIMNHSSQKIDIMISTGLGIEREEAEENKIKYGLGALKDLNASNEERNVCGIINNQIDLILNDIYKHFDTFATKNPDKGIEQILLTGGMANMRGLATYISEAFNLPCNIVGQGEEFVISKKTAIDEDDGEGQMAFFSNIAGAVCRGE